MAVRKYRELSDILKKIVTRLLVNQTLCKLIYYNTINPLEEPDLTDTSILMPNLIRTIPSIGNDDTSKTKIVLLWVSGDKNLENNEISDLSLEIFVCTPFSEWVINGDELRLFYIMSEIEDSLQGKDVNGVGRLMSDGFKLDMVTNEMATYKMEYKIDVFK